MVPTECDHSDSILRTDSLSDLFERALALIRKHLFSNATRVNESKGVSLTISYPRHHEHFLSPAEIMFELEKIDLDKKLGVDSTYIKGCYDSDDGKVYLNKEFWCIETIIHEVLHACSVTSAKRELLKYRPLFEGLTEFYTGYILYKEYGQCYTDCWRIESGRKCQMTYEDTVKLWAAFCNFIPIAATTGIYFYKDSINWNAEVTSLIKKVQNAGYKRFQNLFVGGNSVLKFNVVCRQAFGNEFGNICASRNRFTDYSSIKY